MAMETSKKGGQSTGRRLAVPYVTFSSSNIRVDLGRFLATEAGQAVVKSAASSRTTGAVVVNNKRRGGK